jgi:signal transduction histidine kinase
MHAQEAFLSSFFIALALALVAALTAAGLVSWFLVRRVSRPVAALADTADALAAELADADATRSRLLADLAHELRTPQATLEAYIDGLEDDGVPIGPESFQTMRDQVSRLRRLAADLRDAATDEHDPGLTLEPADPNQLADAAVAAAAPHYLAKDVDLALVTAAQAPTVLVDQVRIQQLLANLLDNALRHTPTGGHVTVSVGPAPTGVNLRVTDDGEGIPADQLDAVFERFHRVDPSRTATDGSGSGLGLTIGRAIAAAHGGTLSATSAGPGQGATFTLALPPAGTRKAGS